MLPVKWEKVHVFISSTFNDMHAERDYLAKRVFPRLSEWCERRKLRLVDIDLRWGVTEADSSSKQAVKVCLERINDCRPFFLCFLGQRHGWIPGEEGISDDTYEEFPELRKAVELHPDASVTELEILHAIISPFASRNSEDRSRLIRYDPSEQAFFYLRDPRYVKDLHDAPRQLQCIYTDNAGPEDETEEEHRSRERSREALRKLREYLIPKNARHEPVVYGATWRSELRTPEIAIPLGCPSLNEGNRGRWRQAWNRFARLGLKDRDLEVPEKKRTAANEYNARLTQGRLADFRTTEPVEDLQSDAELASVIERQLQQAIASRFPDHVEVVGETDLQRELDQQEQFLYVSSEGFIEREGDFKELDAYVESESDKLFVLTAPGGMGKSALLANWIDRYRTRIEGRSDCSVHFRFVGASDRSTTVYSLLRFLLQELKDIGQKLDEEIPDDPTKLREALPRLLEAVGKRGRTVFVIDALNQLESGFSDLNWLPWKLPSNIKLITSFKRGEAAAEEFYRRLKESGQVVLSEVKPFEDEEDRRKLVRAYLKQYLKELDEPLLESTIQSPGSKNPLYLKIVLSELRVFGAFASLKDKIRGDFGDNPVSAFQSVLARLETDPAYSAIEPRHAVPLLFGLLAHARHGLSPNELSSIFTQALRTKEALRPDAAADAVHLFMRQVRPFLARREGRYDFFFESFKKAAQECYVAESLSDPAPRRLGKLWHGLLADYFRCLPNWDTGGLETEYGVRRPVRRKVAELPYHLTCGELWKDLGAALCDLDFIEAKCTAKMTYDLVADYNVGLAAIGADADTGEFGALTEFSGFVRREAHVLSAYPWLTFQQAANQPDRSGMAIAARKRWETGAELRSWMQRVNKPQHADLCMITLKGHSSGVLACAYSPDGNRIVSASGDQTLRVWDAETGAEIATLKGHSDQVEACAYSPDGNRIVSGSKDGTMKVWDGETGAEVGCFIAPAPIKVLAIGRSSRLTAAGRDGFVIHLRRVADVPTVPISSITHLYCFDTHSWSSQATAGCEWCGQRFTPSRVVLDAIRDITARAGLAPDESPCVGLPSEAWDDPRLLSECPYCHEALRFNPFIVDNRNRY